MNMSDIASPELGAVEVHGMSRASFILRGAVAAGAVYGASAVGPYVSSALAQGGSADIDILNFALTLEYLETDFYNVKGAAVGLSRRGEEAGPVLRGRGGRTRRRAHQRDHRRRGEAGRQAELRVPRDRPGRAS